MLLKNLSHSHLGKISLINRHCQPEGRGNLDFFKVNIEIPTVAHYIRSLGMTVEILTFFLFFYPKLIFSAQPAASVVPVLIEGQEMEIKQKGAVTVFKGAVKLTYGENIMTADEMTDYREQGKVTANGNIYAQIKSAEKQDLLKIYGQKAWFDKNKSAGEISENVKVIYSTSSTSLPLQLQANSVKFWIKPEEKSFQATGEVVFRQDNYQAFSEEAWFYEKERKLVLSGDRPQITQKNDKNSRTDPLRSEASYAAEQIVIFLDEKRVILEKEVKIEFYP